MGENVLDPDCLLRDRTIKLDIVLVVGGALNQLLIMMLIMSRHE